MPEPPRDPEGDPRPVARNVWVESTENGQCLCAACGCTARTKLGICPACRDGEHSAED